MKKKHRLGKFFQSFLSNHSDAENSEALQDREDVDKKVEKILKMLRTEESGTVSSEDSFDKAELASFIDNFHKRYQAVNGRYDDLMGKLKKKIGLRGSDNGSLSNDFISSDSESSDSGFEEFSDRKEKSRKAQEGKAANVSLEDYQNLLGQLENMKVRNSEFETMAIEVNAKLDKQNLAAELAESAKIVLQAEVDGLRKELDLSLKKEDDTREKLRGLHEENEALKSGNAEAFSRIHEADKLIENFQTELDQIKVEMQKVMFENSNLKEELEKTSKEIAGLNQQLQSTSEEKEALRSGNFVFLRRIQEAEKALADIRYQADQKLNLITELESQNANLSSENGSLKHRLEAAARQETDMIQRLSAAEEEVSSMKAEILRSSILIQEAEKTIGDLKTESEFLKDENLKLLTVNNDLNQQLKAIVVENEALASEQLKAVEVILQAEEKTSMLSVEVETLKDENSKLLVENEKLRLELEGSNDKVSELRLILESSEGEKQSLAVENSALLNRLQQAEKAIDDLKSERDQLGSDKSQLQIKINDLDVEVKAANSQVSDLTNTLNVAEEEKNGLSLEISGLMIKLQQAESNVKQQKIELEHLREESVLQQNQMNKAQEAEKIIDDLKAEAEQLRADNCQLNTNVSNLGLELEASGLQLTDLNKALVTVEEEKMTLASENSIVMSKLQQAENNIETLESNLFQMRHENSMLQQSQSKLQEAGRELNEELKQLTEENSQLQIKIKDLSLELEAANLKLADLKTVIEAAEEEKTSLASEIVTMMTELQQVGINVQTLKAELAKLQEENSILEHSQNNLQSLKIHLEGKLGEKEKEIGKLEESCKELLEKLELTEEEKEDEDKENAKLNKIVQTLEVQLRLSNQKLKITETENKEKVEGYTREREAMKEDRRVVEEQMLRLCRKMNSLENEVRQLKEVAEVGISALDKEYHELETAFEDNSGHILKRLCICSEELTVLKKWLTELKNEKQELSVRLKYKEGIMSMMKDEAEGIRVKLAKMENEVAILRANAMATEERMKALEEMLREKKKEVSDKDEAKREAIRQLCLLIEYHRENCEHLYKYLSSVLKRSGRSL